jgi:hypothetical protein
MIVMLSHVPAKASPQPFVLPPWRSVEPCFGRQEMQYQPDGQRQKPNISTVDESYAHKVPGGILRTPSSCTKHPKMVLTVRTVVQYESELLHWKALSLWALNLMWPANRSFFIIVVRGCLSSCSISSSKKPQISASFSFLTVFSSFTVTTVLNRSVHLQVQSIIGIDDFIPKEKESSRSKARKQTDSRKWSGACDQGWLCRWCSHHGTLQAANLFLYGSGESRIWSDEPEYGCEVRSMQPLLRGKVGS